MPACDIRGSALLIAAAAVSACGTEPPSRRAAEPPADSAAATAAGSPRSLRLPDTMLFRTPNGAEVWWTLARESFDSAGVTCVERGLEIRQADSVVRVPLLYSAEVPGMVDDTTLEARLWTGCVPGRRYHVNVNTGQPTPVAAGGSP